MHGGDSQDAEAAAGGNPARRRFRILAVVWTAYLMVYMARLSVGPLSPFLKEAFDLSNAQVGTLISAGSVSLLFFARSYSSLLVLLALSSVGAGCIFPSAVSAVMRWFPLRERATAIGVNQTAINVSGILGALTLPTIAANLGWQYGFLVIALVGLAVAGVCIVGYTDPPAGLAQDRAPSRPSTPASTPAPASTLAPASTPAGQSTPARPSTRRLLASRDLWLLGLAGLFLGVVQYSTLAHLVLYTKVDYLLAAVTAGLMLALCQASGALGKPLAGLISDRRFSGLRRPALLAMAALTVTMCLILGLTAGRLGWGIYPAVAALGFGAIGWGGVYGTAAGEMGGPLGAGRVSGFTAAGVNIGGALGAPLFGLAVDTTGSYLPSWLLMAGSAALALACFAIWREPHVTRADIVTTLAEA